LLRGGSASEDRSSLSLWLYFSACLSELDTQHWASGSVILDSGACHSKVNEGSSLPVPRGGEEAADPVPTV
jgi:hypothetical protein